MYVPTRRTIISTNLTFFQQDPPDPARNRQILIDLLLPDGKFPLLLSLSTALPRAPNSRAKTSILSPSPSPSFAIAVPSWIVSVYTDLVSRLASFACRASSAPSQFLPYFFEAVVLALQPLRLLFSVADSLFAQCSKCLYSSASSLPAAFVKSVRTLVIRAKAEVRAASCLFFSSSSLIHVAGAAAFAFFHCSRAPCIRLYKAEMSPREDPAPDWRSRPQPDWGFPERCITTLF